MKIYFNCSFRNSQYGFQKAVFDYESKTVFEVNEIELNSLLYIKSLDYEMGKTMILGTDETGKLHFGVFGIGGDESGKYVNAVFYDDDIYQLYRIVCYFCYHMKTGRDYLERIIKRDDTRHNGYEVDLKIVENFIDEVRKIKVSEIKLATKPNCMIAYISEENYREYEGQIKKFYYNKDILEFNERDIESSPDIVINKINQKISKENVMKQGIIAFISVIIVLIVVMRCLILGAL